MIWNYFEDIYPETKQMLIPTFEMPISSLMLWHVHISWNYSFAVINRGLKSNCRNGKTEKKFTALRWISGESIHETTGKTRLKPWAPIRFRVWSLNSSLKWLQNPYNRWIINQSDGKTPTERPLYPWSIMKSWYSINDIDVVCDEGSSCGDTLLPQALRHHRWW